MPVSMADCNSSSNFLNLVRAIDFQSSSLEMFRNDCFCLFLSSSSFQRFSYFYGAMMKWVRKKKSSKNIRNAKTNDRKFITSGTRAIFCFCFETGKWLRRLHVMFKLSNRSQSYAWKTSQKKKLFYAKLNIGYFSRSILFYT